MLNRQSSHLYSFIRSAFIAALTLLIVVPSSAYAALITVTFDDGFYDETIPDQGGETHGPYDWIESGIRVAGFWSTDVGTANGSFQQGHTHITPNFGNRADGRPIRIHAWTDDLQGLVITLENGSTFDLVSIDYSISARDTANPSEQPLNWTFGPEDARLLLSTSLPDPTEADLESQWTAVQIDDLGSPFRPWFTLPVSGFDAVDQLVISTSVALLSLDSIVIDVHDPVDPIPEPSTAVLFGLGLFGLSLGSRRIGRL